MPNEDGTLTAEEEQALDALPEGWQPESLPDNIGDCVDLLYTTRSERLIKEKEVQRMKSAEENLRNHIFNTFAIQNIEGAKGKIATVTISEELKPQVNDWDAVWEYVFANNATELIEKRMARIAYRELFEAGILVPGTEAFIHKKLNCVKSTRSPKGK